MADGHGRPVGEIVGRHIRRHAKFPHDLEEPDRCDSSDAPSSTVDLRQEVPDQEERAEEVGRRHGGRVDQGRRLEREELHLARRNETYVGRVPLRQVMHALSRGEPRHEDTKHRQRRPRPLWRPAPYLRRRRLGERPDEPQGPHEIVHWRLICLKLQEFGMNNLDLAYMLLEANVDVQVAIAARGGTIAFRRIAEPVLDLQDL